MATNRSVAVAISKQCPTNDKAEWHFASAYTLQMMTLLISSLTVVHKANIRGVKSLKNKNIALWKEIGTPPIQQWRRQHKRWWLSLTDSEHCTPFTPTDNTSDETTVCSTENICGLMPKSNRMLHSYLHTFCIWNQNISPGSICRRI